MDLVVETTELHKHFGSIRAVDGVSLSVERGQIYGLLGPNGSGKTTLIRLFIGLLRPTAGAVKLLGEDVPNKSILSQVGYMTQASALYEELTVRENVTFFAEMCGRSDQAGIDEVIDLVDLQDRSRSLVRTLSGGLRQRTSLACALSHKPRLLLLDEPTVGVDPQLRATFWSYFRSLADTGVTLIVSSHVMEEAERCDRLGFIRQGKLLADGSPAQLRNLKNTSTLEEAFLQFAVDGVEGGE
ncbi:MAG: ATP-binding cassette domain-containing protein [Anaerolineales bacterium]|nr:ATP-binding cassette domain-containing protein [Anaerolineales bacterium]